MWNCFSWIIHHGDCNLQKPYGGMRKISVFSYDDPLNLQHFFYSSVRTCFLLSIFFLTLLLFKKQNRFVITSLFVFSWQETFQISNNFACFFFMYVFHWLSRWVSYEYSFPIFSSNAISKKKHLPPYQFRNQEQEIICKGIYWDLLAFVILGIARQVWDL
jgi:hypothetical protein